MALLKTEATSIGKRTILPAIPTAYHEQPIDFSPQDIAKIIEQVVTKGPKYTHLRKTLTPEEATSLPLRLQDSYFIRVMIRKIVIKMGEQRRLGNGLRGFNRLLLQEIENQCWPLVLIQRSLIDLQKKEKQQLDNINQLFQNSPYLQTNSQIQ